MSISLSRVIILLKENIAMKQNGLLVDGKPVKDVTVYVAFPKRQAPYKRFAVVNLNAKVNLNEIRGQEAKFLLSLIFSRKPCVSLKELALAVGIPTANARRALRRLVEIGLVEQPKRGLYRCSRSLRHFGAWMEEEEEV
jgi:predicted transcriptional regulator